MPILDFSQSNPLSDGRQSERALSIRRGVVRHFQELGVSMIAELALASGRRADLIGMDRKGKFVIIEIKSSIEDFKADRKWPEYLVHCDHYFFATHGEVPMEIFPEDQGLIVADHYGAEIVRPSQDFSMAGATRKALTLRFARAAADRLERVLSHCSDNGDPLPSGLKDITGQ
ncbi:MAG: MmcB family DNA repair protein [Pseudomonadota bacterium]